jgi:predicted nucleotidyltransferase
MNLSEPLAGLTSAVDSAVLRVLARADIGFSGRQVHRLAGVGSTSSVHRSLTSLVEVGVVTAQPQPPAIVYRLNRDHVLWPAVESGLSARPRVFEEIGRYCSQVLDRQERTSVVVYGSVARGESSLGSDIDLFVVQPDSIDADARADFAYELAQHVQRITGNAAQIFGVERTELAERINDGDPLVKNVLADGILVHGKPLDAASKERAS